MARIALCDDSKTTVFGLSKKLLAAGHEIVGKAYDGDEGIAIYLAHKPDLMILDITMPNKSGKECLESIIKTDPTANIIMISGVQDETTIQQCLMLGAKAFIPKAKMFDDDFFKIEILGLINKILNVKQPE